MRPRALLLAGMHKGRASRARTQAHQQGPLQQARAPASWELAGWRRAKPIHAVRNAWSNTAQNPWLFPGLFRNAIVILLLPKPDEEDPEWARALSVHTHQAGWR